MTNGNVDVEKVLEEVPEYSNHLFQLKKSLPSIDRLESLEKALLGAFSGKIEYKQVAYICFGELNAEELAKALYEYPLIIKAILSCVNVAQRAISRDLGFNFDTYGLKISQEQSLLLAGYIKPFLPAVIAIPALIELDRYAWTDKELRAAKGNWEKKIVDRLCEISGCKFVKLKFEAKNTNSIRSEMFELDAALIEGGVIKIGIDIKRIESPRDVHKRADEIINKATKYKSVNNAGVFVAVIYFPFPTQQINVMSRLKSNYIDHVFFAGENDSSIDMAMQMLSDKLS